MIDLSSHHAVVTGSGTGIGLSIARSLAAAGARVTLMGRNLERLEQVSADIARAKAVRVDVTDEASVETAMQVAQALAPVSILPAAQKQLRYRKRRPRCGIK
jgi:3-hydroxybutyrate dehydrogenase